MWDPVKNIYITTGEIKSSDDEPALFQVKEQMIGLLKAGLPDGLSRKFMKSY